MRKLKVEVIRGSSSAANPRQTLENHFNNDSDTRTEECPNWLYEQAEEADNPYPGMGGGVAQ